MLQMRRVVVGTALALGILSVLALATAAFADAPLPTVPVTSSPAATASPAASLTVLGQVTNGTPGGSLPVTTTVSLYAVDGESLAFIAEGTADAAGKVRFENVAHQDGRAYVLTALAGSVQYQSDVVAPEAGENILTLPLRVYDTTTDAGRLRVDQMYVVGQFLSDKQLQVINAYVLSNDGDRTVEGGEKTADGRRATLRFYLPPGATNIEFQNDDGQKYARTQDGYVTTWGVPPGANTAQVAMRYTLPYTGQLHLETRTQYPVQKVTVLLANQGITLTGASLVDQGMQTGQDGVARRTYTGDGMAAGQSLAIDLRGSPQLTAPVPAENTTGNAAAQPVQPPVAKPDDRRLIGESVIALGLLGILVACVWRIRSLRRPEPYAMGEHRALFEALADLDEEHDAGKIADADYADQREFLKAALLAALQDSNTIPDLAPDGRA